MGNELNMRMPILKLYIFCVFCDFMPAKNP